MRRVSTIRRALLLGFAAVFGLWLFSAYDLARRVTEGDAQAAALMARFTEAEEVLSTVRAEVIMSSVYLRDAVLDTRPDAEPFYAQRVQATRANVDRALQRYLPNVDSDVEREHWMRLHAELQAYWSSVSPALDGPAAATAADAYAFVRSEVIPKRETVIQISNDIRILNQDALQEQQGHRLADDFAASDDDRPPARDRDLLPVEQLHDAGWRARRERRAALDQPADILRVKRIDVPGWIDGVEHTLRLGFGDSGRQRGLDENAVAVRLPVEMLDERQDLRGCRIRGQRVEVDDQPGFGPGALLVADVDLGRRVVPDQHDVERRRPSRLRLERGHLRQQLGPDGSGSRCAVQQTGGHQQILVKAEGKRQKAENKAGVPVFCLLP